jgi:TM2 domain-containing membrane protein YozV
VAADPPPVSQLAPEVPAPTAAALSRAMAKSRDERFPSVIDFADSLDRSGGAHPAPHAMVAATPSAIRPSGAGAIQPAGAGAIQPAGATALPAGISAGAEGSAVTALVLNLFLPGVGSLVGGRTGAGVGQLLLFLIGLPLSFFLVGIPIVAAAWIWAVITGIQLMGGKK